MRKLDYNEIVEGILKAKYDGKAGFLISSKSQIGTPYIESVIDSLNFFKVKAWASALDDPKKNTHELRFFFKKENLIEWVNSQSSSDIIISDSGFLYE